MEMYLINNFRSPPSGAGAGFGACVCASHCRGRHSGPYRRQRQGIMRYLYGVPTGFHAFDVSLLDKMHIHSLSGAALGPIPTTTAMYYAVLVGNTDGISCNCRYIAGYECAFTHWLAAAFEAIPTRTAKCKRYSWGIPTVLHAVAVTLLDKMRICSLSGAAAFGAIPTRTAIYCTVLLGDTDGILCVCRYFCF